MRTHQIDLEAANPGLRDGVDDDFRTLRRLSNVAQALENLIVQCESAEMFRSLRSASEQQLHVVRAAMTREIHRNC
jgi:hypothetical protein